MSELALLNRLGAKIRDLRISRNMTQFELAIICNFEKARMSRIESGQTNLTVRSMFKICNALDVDIVELFKD